MIMLSARMRGQTLEGEFVGVCLLESILKN